MDEKVKYLIILVLAMVIIYIYVTMYKERFVLDQLARNYTDADYMKWFGNQKDELGDSMKEYYLQNQMNYNSGARLNTFDDKMFSNMNGYLDMPLQYRNSGVQITADGIKPN